MTDFSKELLTEIAEMLPKIKAQGFVEGREGMKALEKITFTNGMRIEAREDGIWLVDGDEEAQLYDATSQNICSQYSDCASEADYAFYDTSGRDLKGISIQEYGDGDNAYVYLEDGQIASFDVVTDWFDLEFPDEIYLGYISKLFFSTSDTESIFVDMNQPICFKGDHTENGAIAFEPKTRYAITFEYDGQKLIGNVIATPADFN